MKSRTTFQKRIGTCFVAAALILPVISAHAATVFSFDDFNNRPSTSNNRTLSSSADTEAATAWKNVSGLTNLNSVNTENGGSNEWDRSSAPITTNPGTVGSTRIRYATGQITTDNAMTLVAYSATSVTITFDWAADEGNYTTGLFYASAANTVETPLVLLMTLAGNGEGTTNSWNQGASVTITDGFGGINFTNDARFVFKYISGSNSSSNDTWFDNIGISYVVIPEPSVTLLGTLSLLPLLRRRRQNRS